jgi:transcriptional regulator with GAF, ATPase, and Fis domain
LYYVSMANEVLLAWIGMTDLKVARGELGDSLGPIGQAVKKRAFSGVHLLSDHDRKADASYLKWLATQTNAPTKVHTVELSGPTEFGEIYEAATSVIRKVKKELGAKVSLTYHLSPGTPAMAAVWILLAKTSEPGELIESSPEKGVRTVSLPFDIAAEYTPAMARQQDDEITRITQGLPPEAPEFDEIIHRCEPMKRVVAQARRLAAHDVPVLIQGESGTGKELLARAIHNCGARASRPFIPVNCGAIPPELVESEFFGHMKGAFSGAVNNRTGHFETANGGTLFLDEIGELPLPAQVKLLRALQEKKFQKVGTSKFTTVDVRIIAATNRNLIEEVGAGRFREDLFHRIAIGIIRLPALRERQGDLNLLIDKALDRLNQESSGLPGWKYKKLSPGARNLLIQHSWPGNVRELINTLSRAAIWTSEETLQAEGIREALLPVSTSRIGVETVLNRPLGNGLRLKELMSEVASHYLKRALTEAQGNKSEAAKLLGLPSYQTLTNWLEKYDIRL